MVAKPAVKRQDQDRQEVSKQEAALSLSAFEVPFVLVEVHFDFDCCQYRDLALTEPCFPPGLLVPALTVAVVRSC